MTLPSKRGGPAGLRLAGPPARWAERERYFAVDLPPDAALGFYEGFSNQTLWPLFHSFPFLFFLTSLLISFAFRAYLYVFDTYGRTYGSLARSSCFCCGCI